MTEILDRLRRQARAAPRRLVLAEDGDERVLHAASRLAREGLAEVALVGAPATARDAARRVGADLGGVHLIDAFDRSEVERTVEALRSARGERLDEEALRRHASDALFQAAARVRTGLADCLVAGASRTSADVVRAALWLIGLADGVKTLSSFFVMVTPSVHGGPECTLLFADCGVVPDPDAGQLAEIGILAADHYARLTGEAPRIAFLSFSTRGSAAHARVDKVRAAVARARASRPDLLMDGELQADAALDPATAARKAPDSPVAGSANVLIFPDLDSGNIGYKLVQRLGGASAYGPILMGLKRQANDLSRGCTGDEVVEVALIACALADRTEPATRH